MSTWIFPSNSQTFDAATALRDLGEVFWSQLNEHEVGDLVYLYASAPVQAIVAKCVVAAIDLEYQEAPEERPYWRDQAELDERADRRDWMRLRALTLYDDATPDGPRGLAALREQGFSKTMGRSVARGQLLRYLRSIDTDPTPPAVAYWWANQNDNWRTVIDDGTLWAGIHPDGTAPNHWKILEDLAVGDVVFPHRRAHRASPRPRRRRAAPIRRDRDARVRTRV